ncbi:YdaS family helix-turn-helix protein [Rodentibacter caecimuris]|uniref:YdaS family helix-turn-helix protein n=1 Tax=Rodentibacter caecimuris TaxID=1796644 RepID=UPI00211A54DE|nr:YdaS family helix-turn-helix protein [Rodentibacter heylii]MCQ9124735.1 helix-turn-helix domain-containing protein [Rodentibacter heylii]
MNKAIEKAISICGTQQALAEKCGVNQSSVSFWLNGGGITGKSIKRIVAATNNQVNESEIIAGISEN